MTPSSTSGSETRHRNLTVGVRLSPTEKDTITLKADRRGTSVSAFMREAALSDDQPRLAQGSRLSTSEGQQIALVLACLGRLADLITDFENDAYGTAQDRVIMLAALRREIIAVRDQCFAALRRTP